MWLSIAALAGGFVVLVIGADRFVAGAAAIARNFGVSPLIVGLTIVAMGTAAPEMIVAAIAAWNGNPGIAIGNALGSNITNVALVIGATAIVAPLTVHSRVIRRELPLLIVIMVAVGGLMLDVELGYIDGVMLALGMVLLVTWIVWLGLRTRGDPVAGEFAAEVAPMSTARAAFWFIAGLALLLGGARVLVWGAVNVATSLGVSDEVIGLSIVAVGTSLPELAASITSALRKEDDIAVGNVVGSNMFNLLGVMAMPGLIAPGPFAAGLLWRDLPIALMLTLAFFAMATGYFTGRGGRINRVEGIVLVAAFISYMVFLYQWPQAES